MRDMSDDKQIIRNAATVGNGKDQEFVPVQMVEIIANTIEQTGGAPYRCSGTLFAPGANGINWLQSADGLFAYLHLVVGGVDWRRGKDFATKAEFNARDAGATAAGIKQVNEALTQTKPAAEAAVAGVGAVNEGLHSVLTGLRGYREVIGLALGIPIGRMLVEQIHEGAGKAIEGFNAASEAGLGFSASLQDGISKILGMKTATEELAEAHKNLAEAMKDSAKTREEVKQQLDPKDATYQFLGEGGSGQADKKLSGLKDDLDKASKGGVEAAKALKEYQAETERQVKSQAPFGGGIANSIRGERAAGEKSLSSEVDIARAAQNLAQTRLNNSQQEYGQANATAGIAAGKQALTDMWKGITDTAKKEWDSVAKIVGNTGKAFSKEGEKAAKEHTEQQDRKMRQEAHEAEDFFKHKAEQEKANAESAKRFKDQDKLTDFKEKAKEIERLVGTGNLSRSEADKAEKGLMARDQQKSHFMNPEDLVKNLQESLGGKEDPLPTQKEMLAVLKEIQKQGKNLAVLGP